MTNQITEPVPPPDLHGVAKPQGTDLTAAQEKHVETVLAHFSKEGYKVPEVSAEDGDLSELEKYWLVRLPILF